MISITWVQLLNPELTNTLNKIVRAPGPFARSIKVLSILKTVESGQALAKDGLSVLREKHLDLNDSKTMWAPRPGHESESNLAIMEFEKTLFEKDLPRLKYSEMANMELSAHDLAILEPFMTNDIDKPDLKLAPELEA